MELVIGLLVVALATSLILLRASLAREVALRESIDQYEEYFYNMKRGLEFVLSEIKSVDLRGAFESDDEVGVVFKAIKSMISTLDVFVIEQEGDQTNA